MIFSPALLLAAATAFASSAQAYNKTPPPPPPPAPKPPTPAPKPAAGHKLKIVITADDTYDLYVDGKSVPATAGQHRNWKEINTYEIPISNADDHVVSVKVTDSGGVIAGLFAAVYLDNRIVSLTGGRANHFKVSDSVPDAIQWTQVKFDDSKWKLDRTVNPCQAVQSRWGDLITRLDAITNPYQVRALWTPNSCKSDKYYRANKSRYFRLKLKIPKKYVHKKYLGHHKKHHKKHHKHHHGHHKKHHGHHKHGHKKHYEHKEHKIGKTIKNIGEKIENVGKKIIGEIAEHIKEERQENSGSKY